MLREERNTGHKYPVVKWWGLNGSLTKHGPYKKRRRDGKRDQVQGMEWRVHGFA